jgi:hypothetical protein
VNRVAPEDVNIPIHAGRKSQAGFGHLDPVDHGNDVLGVARQIAGPFFSSSVPRPTVEKDDPFLDPDVCGSVNQSVASSTLWSRLRISSSRATGLTSTLAGAGEMRGR